MIRIPLAQVRRQTPHKVFLLAVKGGGGVHACATLREGMQMDQLEMPIGARRGRCDDALYSPVHEADVDLPVVDASSNRSPVHISLQSGGVRGTGRHAGICEQWVSR